MRLEGQLRLPRCPHCGVDSPMLPMVHQFGTADAAGTNKRTWLVYSCRRCGGAILAGGAQVNQPVQEMYPSSRDVDESVPDTPKQYLTQAMNSRHAPAGAVMLAASAVDAMLKAKGYSDGSLYSRIDGAAANHLITSEMALWAHEVRLEANGQRHADGQFTLPSVEDANRVIAFAEALAEFLFILPARVSRGRTGG
ncbi:MAG: DUF4145 domain-containing protein [Rhodanobacter sp.]|nr:MAG: DUF4145 domain-containing protein [Rhodanobacter sp.]TAM13253.1 MAG: DUF4145 domain-containing protein [Rhodanobacter sp.]TAM35327.1 MAG: DUF4145 domain-containing protein [Rhodanobacter sp.]